MRGEPPNVVMLAGPNGAGKSTTAPALLRDALAVTEFVNADVIAQGLSAFRPEGAGIAAGRVMLARIRELARQRASFAFETTLASRLFARWIGGLIETGYQFHLVFLWLPSADFAVARVRQRVRMGGHDIPEETIRRRYDSGLRNFFKLYQPLATTWQMYDNSGGPPPRLIAGGEGEATTLWLTVRHGSGFDGATPMKAKKPKDMAAIFREGTLIKKALAAGVREALRRHKQAGCPIVVWRNGKTVWVPADKIKVPGEKSRSRSRGGNPRKGSSKVDVTPSPSSPT